MIIDAVKKWKISKPLKNATFTVELVVQHYFRFRLSCQWIKIYEELFIKSGIITEIALK